MRFDGVEVKVTFTGDQTEPAVQALHLPPGRPPWRIHFCEDVTAGVSPGTPLLDAGVILRAREKPGDEDDTTVKLRPCRRSQLPDPWPAVEEGEAGNGDEWEVEVEADWAGSRRVLAASCSCDRAGGVVADVVSGRRPVEDLFVAEQLAFLRDCSAVRVNVATLTVLPPVTAIRWRSVEAAPPELGLRAERWTVDGLDFLELSLAAEDVDEARTKQDALTAFVHSLGLVVHPDQDTKTRQVLRHLVERASTGSS